MDNLYDLHDQLADAGWVAVDFYDGSLIYDFDTHRLHVVDLDSYRFGPFTNDMGRMFGSSRFMAPEEFVLGAPVDQRTNVFAMGRTAAVFLAQGTIERRDFRGGDALFEVVCRACAPARASRFATIREFRAAWQAARSAG